MNIMNGARGTNPHLRRDYCEAFQATVISYNILILACCRCGNLPAAQHWRSQMARDAVEPNEVW